MNDIRWLGLIMCMHEEQSYIYQASVRNVRGPSMHWYATIETNISALNNTLKPMQVYSPSAIP